LGYTSVVEHEQRYRAEHVGFAEEQYSGAEFAEMVGERIDGELEIVPYQQRGFGGFMFPVLEDEHPPLPPSFEEEHPPLP
jgi:hypothetical protein